MNTNIHLFFADMLNIPAYRYFLGAAFSFMGLAAFIAIAMSPDLVDSSIGRAYLVKSACAIIAGFVVPTGKASKKMSLTVGIILTILATIILYGRMQF